MNWQRGLIRIWVVGAAVWAVFMLVTILRNPPMSPAPGGGHAFQQGDFVWSIVMIAAPPLLALVAGLIFIRVGQYVVRGFRP